MRRRHPQPAAEPRHGRGVPGRPRKRADLAHRTEQRRGFRANQPVVVVLAERERIERRELPQLAERHRARRRGEHPQRIEIAEPSQFRHRTRIQMVAEDHRDFMREQRIHCRHAATHHRMVHRVVVNQRREMDQFAHRGERDGVRARRFVERAREERERRPKQLPAHAHEVAAHLAHERVILARDDPPHFVRHPSQRRADGRLDVLKRRGDGRRFFHGCRHRAASTARMRFCTSRKLISTANTRW